MIQVFPSGLLQTNALVVSCPRTQRGVLIDPAQNSFASIARYLSQKEIALEAIWLTHSHYDHIAEVAKWDLPLAVHPADAPNLISPGADGLPLPFPITGKQPTHLFADGEILTLGTLKARVIHTPGHSPGGVCFYFEEEEILIAGDTLFYHSMGTLALPTSNAASMHFSLHKLASLPSSVVVYPGHGQITTIGEEKHYYLSGDWL